MLYRNLNDEDSNLWTLEDLYQLRADEGEQGYSVEDTFEEWLENKLEEDFELVEEKEMEK